MEKENQFSVIYFHDEPVQAGKQENIASVLVRDEKHRKWHAANTDQINSCLLQPFRINMLVFHMRFSFHL